MAWKILVVDDSALVRESLRYYIEQHSEWQVCGEAENGKIAVERVRELNPDIVILDWQMPVMNGLEAARQISRIAPDTVLLMLTMHTGDYVCKEAETAGIRHVFSKCESLDNLMDSLRTACSGPER